MANKLGHEDSQAVDVLLDSAGQNGQVLAAGAKTAETLVGSTHVKDGNRPIRHRLLAAERVLRLLEHLPVNDPPQDLVERTLKRIAQAPGAIPHRAESLRPFASDARPHA